MRSNRNRRRRRMPLRASGVSTYSSLMYVKCSKRGPEARITSEQTYHWLSWLAWQMTQRGQSVFSVEGLQLDWLPNRKRLAARAIPALFQCAGLWAHRRSSLQLCRY